MPDATSPHRKFERQPRSWRRKFAGAASGIRQGVSGQSSFLVHGFAATAVVTAAAWLSLSVERWCLLLLCIGIVCAAELLNSSLEYICRSITDQVDANIRRGLDIAAGAVLMVAVTSAVVGGLIFVDALWQRLGQGG
jgi:diacylglycerol kinase